jgi:photosystem II stability/assembly factor-like uncharacterized protein
MNGPEVISSLQPGLHRRMACAALAGAALAGCAGVPGTKGASQAPSRQAPVAALGRWRKLDTAAHRGKQDDIFFANARRGWYVNGAGKIYRTEDAGTTWAEQVSMPGTYFRCIGFVDERLGFAGNIGTEYFPGVTDTTPLYRTDDGGATWAADRGVQGPAVKGLCAIDVLRSRFINAGVADTRVVIHAAGRVGGPAFLMRSLDGGTSWRTTDLTAQAGMLLDVKFFDEANGLLFAATDAAAERSNALILRTADGGRTWVEAYRSKRLHELIWKASFPTRNTGYATVQSYDPERSASQRHVVKTVDGGRTWQELRLIDDFAVREFGIGFVNEQEGWVGASTGGFETRDGGLSWRPVEMGRAVNKIRIVNDIGGAVAAYAIGLDVWKFEAA